jgi:hypothetical protein
MIQNVIMVFNFCSIFIRLTVFGRKLLSSRAGEKFSNIGELVHDL